MSSVTSLLTNDVVGFYTCRQASAIQAGRPTEREGQTEADMICAWLLTLAEATMSSWLVFSISTSVTKAQPASQCGLFFQASNAVIRLGW